MELLEFKYKKLVSYLKKIIKEDSYINVDKIKLILDLLEDEEDEKDELN